MKFDGSSTTYSRGVGVVLYHEEDKVVALSFKLEFPCSNNTAEYKAYLTGLATALEMGVKHLKVLGDSNLVVWQWHLEEAMAEEVREQWIMKFDGSSTIHSRGVRVVLYHEEDKAMTLSFKLEFPCSNNTAEYEAYLTRLATALEMGVKHLKVLGDSNLVVCQAKGNFSVKEPSLAPYRAMAQRMKEKFATFEIEHAPRNENRFADALVALGSQIIFKGKSANIEVNKKEESIIEVLKEKFWEEQGERDWRIPIKETLVKGDDNGIKDIKRLCLGKRRVVPQDAKWDFI